jgi:hypothetical protein
LQFAKQDERTALVASLLHSLESLNKSIAAAELRFQGGRGSSSQRQRRCVAAFVVFENQSSRLRCIRDYRRTWLSSNGCRRRCGAGKHLRFMNHQLNVVQAAEPSNILFENMGHSCWNKCARRMLTLLISLLVFGFSVAMAYSAQYFQRQVPSSAECPDNVSDSDVQANPELEKCLCRALGTNIGTANVNCSSWLNDVNLGKWFTVLSVATLVIVNYFLKLLIHALSSWEKHNSATVLQTWITKKLFIGLFVNTACILLLVNAKFESSDELGFAVILSGQWSDFSASWFELVGVSFILIMSVSVLFPHAIPMLCWGHKHCKRKVSNVYVFA